MVLFDPKTLVAPFLDNFVLSSCFPTRLQPAGYAKLTPVLVNLQIQSGSAKKGPKQQVFHRIKVLYL